MTKTLVIWVQGFEKMISGMYLGDIVRRVILRMSLESDMFGPISSKLSTPFVLRCVPILNNALYMSYVEETILIAKAGCVSYHSIKSQYGMTKHLICQCLGKGQTLCSFIVGSFTLVLQSMCKKQILHFKILFFF